MIQFGVGKLELPLQTVLDMTWSEFVIRSLAFKDKREREEILFREVAYQGYRNNFVFSNSKPSTKEVFWPIGKPKIKKIPERIKDALLDAYREFKIKRDANTGGRT